MEKLGQRNYELIRRMVKTEGSYDPDEGLYLIEEELYVDECQEIILFLIWLHAKDIGMGRDNYEQRFKQFKSNVL